MQPTQTLDPTKEAKRPGEQLMHVAEEISPEVSEALPDSQFTQLDESGMDW
jgi:hypothetical protein